MRLDEQRETARSVAFSDIQIGAVSALVYDLTTNEFIFGKHEELQRPLASITKVMTAVIAMKYLPEDEMITVRPDDEPYSEETKPEIGSVWNKNNLAKFMLVGSSNNAALILAQQTERVLEGRHSSTLDTFLRKMNEKAKKLGLNKTTFNSVTGLDVNGQAQATSTAKDIALLASFAYREFPAIFAETSKLTTTLTEAGGHSYIVNNTNDVVDQIPNLKLSKTGFTNAAMGNVVALYTSPLNGHDIAVVVLGSTHDGRTEDLLKLVAATEDFISLTLKM